MTSCLRVNFAISSAIMIRGEERDIHTVEIALPDGMFSLQVSWTSTIYQVVNSLGVEPFIDEVLNFLSNWQKGLVTRVGRLVLVNTVVRARPTHHVLVDDAPKWAL